MFLHVGGESLVFLGDVVGFFSIETVMRSKDTSDFIALAKSEGRFMDPAGKDAKTFILTTDHVITSSISSATLCRRKPASLTAERKS